MASKKLFTLLGIFAFLLVSLSFASADVITMAQTSAPTNVSHNAGNFNVQFNVTYTGTQSSILLNFNTSVLTSGTGSGISVPTVSINQNQTLTLNALVNFNANQLGNIAGQVNAQGTGGSSQSLSFSVPILNKEELTITQTQALTLSQNGTITVTNTGNQNLQNIVLTATGAFNVTFSTNNFNLNAGQSKLVTVSSTTLSALNLGSNSDTITAIALSGATTTFTLTTQGSLCKYGEVGASLLEIESIKDQTVDNTDSWKWKPLDKVQLDVKIKNTGDNDEDYIAQLIFVDSNGKKVDVADNTDDLEQDVSIDSDKKETISFNFMVAGDVDEGDYKLYAKVYRDGGEKEQCITLQAEDSDTIETIKVSKKTDDVVVKSVEGVTQATAGALVPLQVSFSNIGKNDQDKVKVILFNSELNIRIEKEIDSLDSGDSDTVTFDVPLPQTAQAKTYTFLLSTQYAYDEDNEKYKKSSASADVFEYQLAVIGGSTTPTTSEPTVTVALMQTTQTKVGQPLTVQVSITNTGNTADFILTAEGYESWADLVSVEPSILNIAKSGTKQAVITFTPTTAGEQTFTIKTIYNGQTKDITRQVNIEDKSGFLTGAFSGVGNSGLYIIAGVFLLLIIVIVVLIIKVAVSGRSSEF